MEGPAGHTRTAHETRTRAVAADLKAATKVDIKVDIKVETISAAGVRGHRGETSPSTDDPTPTATVTTAIATVVPYQLPTSHTSPRSDSSSKGGTRSKIPSTMKGGRHLYSVLLPTI